MAKVFVIRPLGGTLLLNITPTVPRLITVQAYGRDGKVTALGRDGKVTAKGK